MESNPKQEWIERFRDKFGSPLREGTTVKLTNGSDTMLVGEEEMLSFIQTVEKEAVERGSKGKFDVMPLVKLALQENAEAEMSAVYENLGVKITTIVEPLEAPSTPLSDKNGV